MQGDCKFCQLEDGKISYKLIVEAIMQLANSITQKQRAEQSSAQEMVKKMEMCRKSMDDMRSTNKNLMQLVEKLEISLKTEKEISELYRNQLASTQNNSSEEAVALQLRSETSQTDCRRTPPAAAILMENVKVERKRSLDECVISSSTSPEPAQSPFPTANRETYILPTSSSSTSNGGECHVALYTGAEDDSTSKKRPRLLEAFSLSNENEPKQLRPLEGYANSPQSTSKIRCSQTSIFKKDPIKRASSHHQAIVKHPLHLEPSAEFNSLIQSSSSTQSLIPPMSIDNVAATLMFMSGPIVSYRFFNSSSSKRYRSVSKELFKTAVESLCPRYGTMYTTVIKSNEEAVILVKKPPAEVETVRGDFDIRRYTVSYNRRVNYTSHNFGQGLLNFLHREDLLPSSACVDHNSLSSNPISVPLPGFVTRDGTIVRYQ